MSDGDREVIYDENGDINQDHVLDDYQKNPKGLAPGDVVTVCAEGLKFYHIRKFKVSPTARVPLFIVLIRTKILIMCPSFREARNVNHITSFDTRDVSCTHWQWMLLRLFYLR